MTTIRDVARAAGVSVATVSRVLNAPRKVRPSTRERVEEAISELDFHPDQSARRLSMGRSFSVSVAMPFLSLPSFVERLRGIERVLSTRDYDLLVSNLESEPRRRRYLDGLMQGRRYDGVILVTIRPTDAEAHALIAAGIPVVLVDADHPELDSVDIDDEQGARLAIEHLIERGHTRIAFVGDRMPSDIDFDANRERLVGFRAAHEAAGLAVDESLVMEIPQDREDGARLVDRLLARPAAERPTALFATTDTVAVGVLDGLRAHGLRAPDDLAVVGFDDLPIAGAYGLSTVRQPLLQSGERAAERLLARLDGEQSAPCRELLPLELMIRQSS